MAKQKQEPKQKHVMLNPVAHRALKVHAAKTDMTIDQVITALVPFLSRLEEGNGTRKK